MLAPEPYAKPVLPFGLGGRAFARPTLPTVSPNALLFRKAFYRRLSSILTNESNQTACPVQWVGAVLACVATFLLLASALAFAEAKKLPLVDNKEVVATVDGEPITLEEFNQAIASSHSARQEATEAGRIDYSAIMKRIINMKLIGLEAREMGLGELPEVKSAVADYAVKSLIELLLEREMKDVKADEQEVERLYREMVKEWKIKSVTIEKEHEAKQIEEEIKAGKSFDTVVDSAVARGVAKGDQEAGYLKAKDLTLPVARVVSKMEIGSVSPILSLGNKGFILFRLEGIRYPEDENQEARQKARHQALKQEKLRSGNAYYDGLKKKHVKVNTKVFDALDYESKKPGLEALLKDTRVVAEIKGETPVTVADLSNGLKARFYHGVDRAIETEKVNKRKGEALEELLQKRVLEKEARRQGIHETEVYKERVKEYENSVVFAAFMKKVVLPDIKLSEKELKQHYDDNLQEYTFPQMMRIRSVVFKERSRAVDAMDKLNKGTDFNWLSSNAAGQIDKDTAGVLPFDGTLLTLGGLPEAVQKAVSGADSGDFRLYASPDGLYYVLYVSAVISPKAKPFEDVKEEIAEGLYKEKVKASIEHWADELRGYYPVEIHRGDLQP